MGPTPAPHQSLAARLSRCTEATATCLAVFRSRVEQSALARRVLSRRLIVLFVALVVGWQVTAQLGAAERVQQSWGSSTAVVVAARSLEAGEILDSSTARIEQMPRRFVPEGALFEVPADRRVAVATNAGEILVRSRVSAAGAGAIGSTLGAETQAVTLSLGEAPAPVQPGDLVDVISVRTDVSGSDLSGSDSPQSGEGEIGAARVAESAVVLQVAQGQATLAVQSKQVDALVAAAASVPISLVILQ
ncbi:unannotated protein [freshwater metagenome]|uniref:Unannotated protein n=1 Tax=freshwater metagenome TaxID=449393 RepID=A0A6J6T0U1_9ZZZZ|nr:hypothetical protein [Actinomycetota bacterium]MSY78998.1 hypothetical protein [Actinomycetota bacterium]